MELASMGLAIFCLFLLLCLGFGIIFVSMIFTFFLWKERRERKAENTTQAIVGAVSSLGHTALLLFSDAQSRNKLSHLRDSLEEQIKMLESQLKGDDGR